MTLAILIIVSISLALQLALIGLGALLLFSSDTHVSGVASMDPPLEGDEV